MKIRLEYERVPNTELSNGTFVVTDRVGGTSLHRFTDRSFQKMLYGVAAFLKGAKSQGDEEQEVILQRTDRDGLLPYTLDAATVASLCEDPLATADALTFPAVSPSGLIKTVKNSRPIIPKGIAAGFDVLAEAFGTEVFFRVRNHELECPGCGFWSMFASPGLLAHLKGEKNMVKATFVCRKKCKERFIVTCFERWGSVSVEDLLKTKLDGFYLPRDWNDHKPWVSRESLTLKFEEFKKEKETCSTTAME